KRGPARGARRARQKRGPPLRRKKVGNPWRGGGWALAPRDRGPEAGMYCWAGHLQDLLLRQVLDDLLGGVSVVLDLDRVTPRRRIVESLHHRLGARFADAIPVDPELGDRERALRLRAGAHDPLERGVARLVDSVGDLGE